MQWNVPNVCVPVARRLSRFELVNSLSLSIEDDMSSRLPNKITRDRNFRIYVSILNCAGNGNSIELNLHIVFQFFQIDKQGEINLEILE